MGELSPDWDSQLLGRCPFGSNAARKVCGEAPALPASLPCQGVVQETGWFARPCLCCCIHLPTGPSKTTGCDEEGHRLVKARCCKAAMAQRARGNVRLRVPRRKWHNKKRWVKRSTRKKGDDRRTSLVCGELAMCAAQNRRYVWRVVAVASDEDRRTHSVYHSDPPQFEFSSL